MTVKLRLSRLLFICLTVTSFCFVTYGQIHRSQELRKSHRLQNSRNSKVNNDIDNVNIAVDDEDNVLIEPATDKTLRNDLYTVWMYSLLSALAVGMCGIFPLLIIPLDAGPSLRNNSGSVQLKRLLSFAVGSLLGDVFLHLLPETWHHTHSHREHIIVGIWVLVGVLFFFIIEKVFGESNDDNIAKVPKDESVKHNGIPNGDISNDISTSDQQYFDGNCTNNNTTKRRSKVKQDHTQEKSAAQSLHHRKIVNKLNGDCQEWTTIQAPCEKSSVSSLNKETVKENEETTSIKVSGYLNLFANVIDNFTHGLAIGGSYIVSPKMGVVTTCAILIHEVPHEVGDFAILLRSGFNRIKAAKAQIVTACAVMVGVTCAICAESVESAGRRTAWILPFTSGGFLYIALVSVTPDLLQENNLVESLKQILCICCGLSAMLLVTTVIA